MRERPDRKLWTDDETEQLKTLATTTDLSASQIAAALGGGFSRLAVIGKCSRLKLQLGQNRPKTAGFERKVSARVPPSTVAKAEKRDAAATQRRKATTSLVMLRSAPIAVAEARAAEFHASPSRRRAFDPTYAPPGSRIVPLVDLERGDCKWPLFEDGPHLFCGGRVTTFDIHGQPAEYCEHHLAMRNGVRS